MGASASDKVFAALETFRIELPSWGFANTGTRFGKFIQPAAATTTEEKFSDAGQVHLLTGVCPTMALHVLWDCPDGAQSTEEIKRFASRYGVAPGSINPNLFQDQEYKYGSLANPEESIRQRALRHTKDSIEIARRLKSRDISFWFADGSNYPGTANIRQRKHWFVEALREAHGELFPDQRMLVEYKPFEPAFYHTDIADWGMALLLSRAAGPRAKVLVDTGHHYDAQNIEQIVAWLLSEDMLGGFHFNDRRYADDDLTMGSIDPYQVFRIFHEIHFFECLTCLTPNLIWLSISALKAGVPFLPTCGQESSQLKKSTVFKMSLSNARVHFIGTYSGCGSKCASLWLASSRRQFRVSALTHGAWTTPCSANAESCFRIRTTTVIAARKA